MKENERYLWHLSNDEVVDELSRISGSNGFKRTNRVLAEGIRRILILVTKRGNKDGTT